MAPRVFLLPGFAAALLALMLQLAAGAYVPAGRPGGDVLGTLCHAGGSESGTPAPGLPGPGRQDCPLCPLCAAVHALPLPVLPVADGMALLRLPAPVPGARPARSGVPGAAPRPPNQPRAPPPVA